MLFNFVKAAGILALASNLQSQVTEFEYAPLTSYLKEAVFPEYSTDQKLFLADQIHKLFTIYGNRDSKVQHYNVDSDILFTDIKNRAANLTGAELNFQIGKAYKQLRDFHTAFKFPAPYACYRTYFPLSFTLIDGADALNPVAAVSGFNTAAKSVWGNELAEVKLGHILVSINGLSLLELYEKYKHLSGGANFYGGMKSILQRLFMVRGGDLGTELQLDENETHVTYELKQRHDSKNTYKVTVPLAGRKKNSCLAPAAPVSHIATDSKKKTPEPFYNDFNEVINESYEIPSDIPYEIIPGTENIIGFAHYKYLGTKLGIIRISSFYPTNYGLIEHLVLTIRGLLVKEFKETDAVVIDVRSNGGGWGLFSNMIPQLFKADFVPGFGSTRKSPINDRIFQNPGHAGFEAYGATPEGQPYSNLFLYETVAETNTFGQAYLKPVAVLNNANCYSSCDIFSAAMQDSQTAKVMFGEDGATGAGGCNVVHHENFRQYNPVDFNAPLPFGVDVTIGWQQLIRNGVNDKKKVEDFGIESDVILRPTTFDLFNVNNRSSVFDRIAHQLRAIGQADGSFWTYFNGEPQLNGDSEVGAPVKFSVTVGYITKLELHLKDKIIDSKTFNLRKHTENSELTGSVANTVGIDHYTIYGYTNDKQVLKTERYIRYIPASSSFLQILPNQTTKWDFKTDTYAALYNGPQTTNDKGFNVQDGKLVVGDGKGYSDSIDTSVSFFVNLNGGLPKIQLDLEFSTETDFDFVYLTLKQKNRKDIEIFKSSGKSQHVNQTFRNLGAVDGPAEIVVRFVSDGGVTDVGGIRLNSISFLA
ncbi:hypothetical protein HK099_000612 [Clydaea vesicula]|uniref:Tail specific protease domain-containing protein n=1 Tax=Clydaea vesicula TaxID=447962 RepID=A0AAD5U442_9FUNG|nr:hypothetical protein HK099_000612 [Clydaea vesicula]KAJ3395382.1 hypothetical protein HDU92_005906 [Lobulomyces angularis]